MGKLDGKVAIVTGGNGGIGRGSCRLLAEEGAAVVVADLPQAAPGKLAEQLNADGFQAIATEVDISVESEVDAMVAATVDAFGRLDGLFANAGAVDLTFEDSRLDVLDRKNFERQLEVNVIGTWLCCKAVIPAMIGGGGGSIVATSSASATHAGRHTAYGVTKAAINQLVRCVAAQFGQQGIRANAIMPGFIVHHWTSELPEAYQQLMLDTVVTPALGNPRSIASLVAYLFSDDAAYLQGQAIGVDGGMFVTQPAPRRRDASPEEFSVR
jgi:NAD(P)-dependent dehydrogenase (short-subunit alcohol dehydrogenase family)